MVEEVVVEVVMVVVGGGEVKVKDKEMEQR